MLILVQVSSNYKPGRLPLLPRETSSEEPESHNAKRSSEDNDTAVVLRNPGVEMRKTSYVVVDLPYVVSLQMLRPMRPFQLLSRWMISEVSLNMLQQRVVQTRNATRFMLSNNGGQPATPDELRESNRLPQQPRHTRRRRVVEDSDTSQEELEDETRSNQIPAAVKADRQTNEATILVHAEELLIDFGEDSEASLWQKSRLQAFEPDADGTKCQTAALTGANTLLDEPLIPMIAQLSASDLTERILVELGLRQKLTADLEELQEQIMDRSDTSAGDRDDSVAGVELLQTLMDAANDLEEARRLHSSRVEMLMPVKRHADEEKINQVERQQP